MSLDAQPWAPGSHAPGGFLHLLGGLLLLILPLVALAFVQRLLLLKPIKALKLILCSYLA